MEDDVKRFSPAADRNKLPILEVLLKEFPQSGSVLEIASGTGQHVVFFAENLRKLHWQPTDLSDDSLASIKARRQESNLPNIREPQRMDVTHLPWQFEEKFDALICSNMVHIAPWEAVEGLFKGAWEAASQNATLVTYGPYFFNDEKPAPSNIRFDESLRARDSSWGVRLFKDISDLADSIGWKFQKRYPMPAENYCLVFEKLT